MNKELKYKLIVSDMDGTILSSKNEVGEITHRAILDFIDAGGRFALCSGREIESLVYEADQMGLDKDKITFMGLNGCVIMQKGEIIRHCDLDKSEVLKVVDYLKDTGLYFQVYDKKGFYIKEENEISRWYCKTTHCVASVVGDLSNFVANKKDEIVKVLVASSEEEIERISQVLPNKFPSMQWFKSCPVLYEGVSLEGGKGNAVQFLADKYGVDLAQTVAIGDSQNDFSMIERAGLGVAVANASEDIKGVADMVLDYSCDEDGVGKFIYSLMEGKI